MDPRRKLKLLFDEGSRAYCHAADDATVNPAGPMRRDDREAIERQLIRSQPAAASRVETCWREPVPTASETSGGPTGPPFSSRDKKARRDRKRGQCYPSDKQDKMETDLIFWLYYGQRLQGCGMPDPPQGFNVPEKVACRADQMLG